jgi:hypothetical protein
LGAETPAKHEVNVFLDFKTSGKNTHGRYGRKIGEMESVWANDRELPLDAMKLAINTIDKAYEEYPGGKYSEQRVFVGLE